MKCSRILFNLVFLLSFSFLCQAQMGSEWQGKFEQLDQILPTPNVYRTGDGSPGPDYWQQQVDYKLNITLDDSHQKISGHGVITYYNKSPHKLDYIWLQLDQNRRASHSDERSSNTLNIKDSIPAWHWKYLRNERTRKGGIDIAYVKDSKDNLLEYFIQKTMMRVDLPKPLKPGEKISIKMAWSYHLNDRMEDRGRSGFEYFPEDDNYLYTIAQFYPRAAVYDDYNGWQHKQFLGAGEFALCFGNFDVSITVPEDHILMATGSLQNAKDVLSSGQYKRYEESQKSFNSPVVIATEAEARLRESQRNLTPKTWHFLAENVRDFAFASSRKFIWDAQALKIGNKTILAQSLYPKEGNPLWEQESTKAVINTLKTYSKYSIDYPYPQATSVHAASIGMEYPMICFNFGRPDQEGNYSDGVRYNMIGVIIHEVGHNFFPMIVNSDERQWTWMDEGLNSFLEYRTEQECYDNFPSSRGPATSIIPYMRTPKNFIRPIMTNSEQVIQLGENAYGKPASALNILRETILGHEAFDKAFKTYSQRWAFKHPKPADFFRTIEDASGVDLDWFWRGWFYSVDAVDIALDTVVWYRMKDNQLPIHARKDNGSSEDLSQVLKIQDFKIMNTPEAVYWEFRNRIDDESIKAELRNKEIYELKFSNKGGLVMPLIIQFEFISGKKELVQLPAEIWRKNEQEVYKVFVFDEMLKNIQLDPYQETADIDTGNNIYPNKQQRSRFEEFRSNAN